MLVLSPPSLPKTTSRSSRVLPHRSYEVRLEDGTTRRRTSRHVRFSSEPPIVFRNDSDDTASASPPVRQTPNINSQSRIPDKQIAQRDQRASQPVVQPPHEKPAIVTRSGRVIKPPARFKD